VSPRLPLLCFLGLHAWWKVDYYARKCLRCEAKQVFWRDANGVGKWESY